MKKLVMILLVSLLTPIMSFSQSTYPITGSDSLITITTEQLKSINLIFNEHKYFKEKVNLLTEQVEDLSKLNSLYIEQDSIRCKEIDEYKNAYEDSFEKYNRLNKRYKIIKGISFATIFTTLLGILVW